MESNPMKKILLTMFLAAIIGCSAAIVKTEGVKLDRDEISKIEAGVSTRADVIDLLGEPSDIYVDDGYEKLIYLFKEKKTPTYVGGLVESELGGRTTTKTLEVVIKDGIATSYKFRVEAEE